MLVVHWLPIAPGRAPLSKHPARHHAEPPATHQPFGLRSWLAWVAAVTAGWAIGWTVGEIIAQVSPDIVWFAFLFQGAHVVGIGAAALQALVLRRHLEQAATWVLATGLAAVVSEVIATYVLQSAYDGWGDIHAALLTSIALTVLVGGLFVGAAQWLILRRRVKRAGWWIPVSGLGLLFAWFVGGFVSTIVIEHVLGSPSDLKAFQLVAGLVAAIIYAALTGYTLARLFRSPSR